MTYKAVIDDTECEKIYDELKEKTITKKTNTMNLKKQIHHKALHIHIQYVNLDHNYFHLKNLR